MSMKWDNLSASSSTRASQCLLHTDIREVGQSLRVQLYQSFTVSSAHRYPWSGTISTRPALPERHHVSHTQMSVKWDHATMHTRYTNMFTGVQCHDNHINPS
jgi:hypothetical protein